MPDDLITQIMKRLKGSPQARADFIQQLIAEQGLYNALKDSGVATDISDPQARARSQPFGVLSAVQKINLVDLITEISTIKNIDLVAAITNIANLASLDLIDRITLIDTITSIGTIGEIAKITSAPFFQTGKIANPAFETGDLSGWTDNSWGATHPIVSNGGKSYEGFYVCVLQRVTGANCANIGQSLAAPVKVDNIVLFSVLARSAAGVPNFRVKLYYSDATSSQHVIATTTTHQETAIVATAGKYIVGMSCACDTDASTVYIDRFSLIEKQDILGIVTANAGTNLNTSALALEATLGTVHGHAHSIDSKITACDTNAVTIVAISDGRTYKRVNGYKSAAGNNTILNAVAEKFITVYDYSLQAEGTVIVTFQDGAGGAELGQRWSFQAREGKLKHGIPPNSPYDFSGQVNTLLNMNLSAAIRVNYEIIYCEQ